jgi:hypothetical protein
VAAKKQVIAPTKVIMTRTFGAYSKRGEHLTIKKTPAVQRVSFSMRSCPFGKPPPEE